MSTIKTNNVQLGQSVTATNNFTWYQPASPDGTVRLGNGNAGSVTDLITVGSTGNLTFTGTTETYTNSVVISAASTKTLTLNGGAGSNGLVIDANNNVGIGTSSPTQKLQIAFSTADANGTLVTNTSTGNYFAISAMGTNAYGITDWQNSTVFEAVPQSAGGLVLGTYTGSIKFQTGTRTTRLILDASGNLGLGVTPSGWVSNRKVLQVGGLASAALALNGTSAVGEMFFNCYQNTSGTYNYSQSSYAAIVDFNSSTAGGFTWRLAGSGTGGGSCVPSSAMTLDASGNLLVGKTSASANGTGAWVYPAGGINLTVAGTTGYVAGFYTGGSSSTNAGSIYCNAANTVQYITSSDQRLKENIVDASSALSSVNAIKVRSFDWKSDGSHVDYGYIAQELVDVAPEAVHTPADPDEMMGVDFGKLTPRLVKAIQELSQEIETLKQKVN